MKTHNVFTGYERKTKVTENSVTYHGTEVFHIKNVKGGTKISLDNGGWGTSTTKHRINQAFKHWGIDCLLYQENWGWYIKLPHQGWDDDDHLYWGETNSNGDFEGNTICRFIIPSLLKREQNE